MSRTLLVTGGCGYLGSEVLRRLVASPPAEDLEVRVLDNLQGGGYPALLDLPADAGIQFVEGDLLDPTALRFALSGADAVIHLAGITKTPFSFENPTWLEQVNHWGTARLVDLCIEAGVKQFVYASSCAVYGPGGPFQESDVCRPIGPYAQSKLKAEHVVREAEGRGLPAVIMRLGTLFGPAPQMRFDAVVNRFAYLAGVGRPLTVFGDGQQRRPSIHVGDAARLMAGLITTPVETTTTLNVAVGNPSVEELKEIVVALRPDTRVRYTEQDVLTYLSLEVDTSRLAEVGFVPASSVEDGLAELLARFTGLEPAVYPPPVS